ncbi:MAG: hypothetical protein DI582_08625 [Azospirillum brasilense]|nr:MAG: hypothetical protein DI582_08625 [Azospirillum brasilense]
MAPNAGAAKNMDATLPKVDAPTAAPAVEEEPAEPVPELGDAPIPSSSSATPTTDAAQATADQTAEQDEAASLNVQTPPTSLPGLTGFAVPPGFGPSGANATGTTTATLPEINVDGTEGVPDAPKPAVRTWKTTLAPAIRPVKTNFNFRRQILPNEIYRSSYTPDNRHLPTARTREYYVQLLIGSVARNDLNGTRALLNTGISVNTTDGSGASLLSIARQYGARDTERLLIARGANS